MSDITDESIVALAHLARIRVDESEMSRLRDGMHKILNFVDELSELGEIPSCMVVDNAHVCIERADECATGDLRPSVADVLANAPEVRDNMYVVPSAINSGE